MAKHSFFLTGNPRPKGSWIPVARKGGGFDFRHASSHTAKWCVSAERQVKELYDGPIYEGPIVVTATFYLERPKTVKRRYPIVRGTGDLDKLLRAVYDAMTGVVYVDDVQVMVTHTAKYYTDGVPGVQIDITTDGV